ncbi:MAG: glycosyltransferase [Spirochaetes bacterium]|nr:glycosyltransferase [Spirochaetota bacterium]
MPSAVKKSNANSKRAQPIISVVVPTYNEAQNLPILIPRIASALAKMPHEIIVADDNSPDGTFTVAKNLEKKFPQVKSILRTHNRGLSPSVLDAFAVATGEYLAVIDADLQHDEKILPRFVDKFVAGSDIVIGSRKAEGGGIEGWSALRRFVSWTATQMARILLPGLPSDPMSGFFAIRAKLYYAIAPQINPRGFKILLEIIAHTPKAKIAEVGYVFRPRTHGESKLSGSVILSYLMALYDLRFGKILPIKYIKFSLVGLLGLVVNQSVLFLLKRFAHLTNEIALVPAIEVAIIFNYFLNNLFTFRETRIRGFIANLKGLVLFQVICLFGAYINYATALHLSGFLHVNIYAANFLGILLASFWNYFINSQVIWHR